METRLEGKWVADRRGLGTPHDDTLLIEKASTVTELFENGIGFPTREGTISGPEWRRLFLQAGILKLHMIAHTGG